MTGPPLPPKEPLTECTLKSSYCSGGLCEDHKGTTIRGTLCRAHNLLLGFYEEALEIEPQLKAYIAGELTTFIISEKLSKKKNCTEPNCTEKIWAKQFCWKHYARKRRADIKQTYYPSLKSGAIPKELTDPLPSDRPTKMTNSRS